MISSSIFSSHFDDFMVLVEENVLQKRD
jgi:hypothetical protein